MILQILYRVDCEMPVHRAGSGPCESFLGHGVPLRLTPHCFGCLGLRQNISAGRPLGCQALVLDPAGSEWKKGHGTGEFCYWAALAYHFKLNEMK